MARFVNTDDRTACLRQRRGYRQEEGARAGDDDALADAHPLTLGERLSATRRKHPGKFPTGDRQRAIEGPGRKYDGAGAIDASIAVSAVGLTDHHVDPALIDCPHVR